MDPQRVDEVRVAIDGLGFRAEAFLDSFESMRAYFRALDGVLFSVGAVAVIVAGLGIVNTLFMAVLERFREIGLYKALGASDGDVLGMFLGEAAVVGVLGGTGGLGLGLVTSAAIEASVERLGLVDDLRLPAVEFLFPGWLLLGAVGFALAISLLGGLLPALRAARIDPILALRSE